MYNLNMMEIIIEIFRMFCLFYHLMKSSNNVIVLFIIIINLMLSMLCSFCLFIMFISLIIVNNFGRFLLMKYSQCEMLSYRIQLRNYLWFVLILHNIDLVYLIQEFILLIQIIFLMKILINLFHQYQEDNFL